MPRAHRRAWHLRVQRLHGRSRDLPDAGHRRSRLPALPELRPSTVKTRFHVNSMSSTPCLQLHVFNSMSSPPVGKMARNSSSVRRTGRAPANHHASARRMSGALAKPIMFRRRARHRWVSLRSTHPAAGRLASAATATPMSAASFYEGRRQPGRREAVQFQPRSGNTQTLWEPLVRLEWPRR